MYIAAYLRQQGIKTNIIDVTIRPFSTVNRRQITEEILRQVKISYPKIVGIPCMTSEFQEVIELSRKIKRELNAVTIVVGGIHPTLRPDDFFFEKSPVDYVISGEGEITTFELARAIMEGGTIGEVLGIAWFDKSKMAVVKTKLRPLIQNLDELPFPAFDMVDMKYYTTPNPYSIRGILISSFYILSGRGCPFNCTFCVAKQLRKNAGPGMSVRFRSAKNVADEIQLLVKDYSIDGFYVVDDTFAVNAHRTIEFCDELLSRRLNITWGCETRVNKVSEELLKRMKKAGCIQLDFGVESGSQKVLDHVQKGITVSEIKAAFKLCHKLKIRTFANMLVNLPGETEEDIKASLKLLDVIKPTVVAFNVYTPYVGTEISSQLDIAPDDYYLLGYPPLELVKSPKFRFAIHDLDFTEFYKIYFARYNHLLTSVLSILQRQYIKQLIVSKRKKEYLMQISETFGELKRQKFGKINAK
jgi:radical SAM superfamily enzyme YgiQ (UPF0313 family)